jgi:hypothetical protein
MHTLGGTPRNLAITRICEKNMIDHHHDADDGMDDEHMTSSEALY